MIKVPCKYIAGDFYICTMRYFLLLVVLFQFGCSSSSSDKGDVRKQVTGDWFILYPDEDLKNPAQEKLYARLQDSLVNLKGVKMVSFFENGTFIQWDSTVMKGKWGVAEEEVVVSKAGTGFQNFKSTYSGYKDGVLKLTEFVNADGETLKLVWHLKKITGSKFAGLFGTENNQWRTAPGRAETDDELKQRLSKMLSYYSLYFKLISEESSYFMPMRIMLPVRFYQHAIGMKDFDEDHRFVSLFSSKEQAKKAFDYLKMTVNGTNFDLPEENKNSYSFEYAQMLEKMAEEVVK